MVKDSYSHDDVNLNAYLRWENAGKPYGKDLEFWFQAEQYLKDITDVVRRINNLELELLRKQREAYDNYTDVSGTLVDDGSLVISREKQKPVCATCGCKIEPKLGFRSWLYNLFCGKLYSRKL